MALHRLIEEFEACAKRAESSRDLFNTAEAAAIKVGFSRLALVHGLAFRLPARCLIRLDNFNEWAEIFVAQRRKQQR